MQQHLQSCVNSRLMSHSAPGYLMRSTRVGCHVIRPLISLMHSQTLRSKCLSNAYSVTARLRAHSATNNQEASYCVGHKVRQSRPSLSSPPASRQTVSDLQSWLLFNTHAKQQLAAQIPEQELKDLLEARRPRQDLIDLGRKLHDILQQWVDYDSVDEDDVSSPAKASSDLHEWCRWLRFMAQQGSTARRDLQLLQLLLYYAACTSNSKLVHRLLDEGVPCSTAGRGSAATHSTTPVLALAIVRLDHSMVQQLLSRGADPYSIPPELYLPVMHQEGMHGLPVAIPKNAAASAWCSGSDGDRLQLQEALVTEVGCGFTMCYWLARATKLPLLTSHANQVMKSHSLQRVPTLRTSVIGQEGACSLLYNQVMIYMGMSGEPYDSPKHKPLVLLLAGPPGHGKTLIGQQLQHMLDVPYLFEDCSKLNHISDLLGATGSFQNSERQPTFAAFMRANSGKRSVVVLDEFEKMCQDVQESLLGPLQNGWYIDPYSQERVDCSKTIFLLTTNAADREIIKYWNEHHSRILQSGLQPSVLKRCLAPLNRTIRAATAAATSRSLTSRVAEVVPFFPFTEFERMVVVQQELLNLKQNLAKPDNQKIGRTFGNITIKLQDQPQVLRKLGNEHYIVEEGARAVVNGISNTVESDIKCAVLEERLAAIDSTVRIMAAEDPSESYALELDAV